ncbi:glycoside hydrolase family 3 C-terminal domain-containing protein [Nguyenibacter sp. L1]|uniref:beta-glucosidase family protein n=1 Tax=Nguyenibacter sp. L1 TaxID=3049350 RepID=UPI002B46B7F2|nr:glycoside hydrolase family 3 C-terminal domain-containing protein [Nguyenibacter sp. L1]WRH89795.1 glycoside hydrolase family 3 C-terminal domain-containing protein [Nguyenibacter sp. L1]
MRKSACFLLLASTTVATPLSGFAAPVSPPDGQADAAISSMTVEQKLSLVMSKMGGDFPIGTPAPPGSRGGAAFLIPPPNLGLPTLQISDAGLGVADPDNIRANGASVSLPSGLATASSWDEQTATQAGAMIGQEAWREGFNILLAGGADLTRDPRGGRNFEYAGEDPLLTGHIVGHTIAGIQSQHVLSPIKHFAMNDLETSRMTMSANIDSAALRESDLLGFEIGIEIGHPGAVMCSYNRLNELYACENPYLLTKTLKQDWHYPGFVMSDWGGTHSAAKAALAGLDQESGGDKIDARPFFGSNLAADVHTGKVPRARLDDMVHRILRSIYAVGLAHHAPVIQPIDVAADTLVAQHDEEEGAVLLRNQDSILPLRRTAHVAVIGGHADVGVISGGGSSQVEPIGGNPVKGSGKTEWPGDPIYFPSSPLDAMHAEAPGGHIDYASGTDIARATELARHADVAIVFATQFCFEGADVPDLSLPDHQNELIAAVAKVNPHTIVVLETGNPVLMPWLPMVQGVVEAWYPGSGGGPAIARLLYGSVSPSGHLPMTFPRSASQLPHPEIAGVAVTDPFEKMFLTDQELPYDEGSDVGYRWFDAHHEQPLFPFGYGLTYTSFQHENLKIAVRENNVTASFTVKNTGPRAGVDVPQIYIGLPDHAGRRLAGWARIALASGEERNITLNLEPRILAHFDAGQGRWNVPTGKFRFWLASSASDASLATTNVVHGWSIQP